MKNVILSTALLLLVNSGTVAQIPSVVPNKPEIVKIDGGAFDMGSETGEKNETPVHNVTVSDFSIGKYPVTVSQYKEFCEATGYKMPKAPKWGWYNNHPMVNISYNDAISYCNWLSEEYGGSWRLPTEAEWEYAARGGNQSKGYIYSGSNDLETIGWFLNNSKNKTQSVGLKSPNELGLYDMSGNVFEWCNDWYGESYYTESSEDNPLGITKNRAIVPGSFFARCRVIRGGSWHQNAVLSRVSARSYYLPKRKWYNIGFRVVFFQKK